jgi:hypothetical protein
MLSRLLTGGRPRPPRREMRHVKRTVREHPVRAIVRQGVGWTVLLVGVLGIVLPLTPAIVLIPAGVAIVGRRQTLIRWARTRLKLLLRVVETLPGVAGRLGRRLASAERRVAKVLRERRLRRFEKAHPDASPA